MPNRLFRFILFLLGAAGLHAAPLEVSVSSRFLVEGEQAELRYIVRDSVGAGVRLDLPEVPGLTITPVGFGAEPRLSYGRRPEYVFRYIVQSYESGTYTIPPATLEGPGVAVVSDPVRLQIIAETELNWQRVRILGEDIPYAAAFLTTDDRPFVNEVLPTELKLYFPATQRVEDWGIPEFERDGVAAWRFEPRPTVGRARLLGRPYRCISYPSSLSPTRPGPVRLGPGTLRLMTVQTAIQQFGRADFVPANLEIPALELEARPLPDGAPTGFEDAVGTFQLDVRAAETEVHHGDPVTVTIVVSGTGNLDTLNAPTPVDSEGWRLYPASPMQREDRREISGVIGFRQFMRPLGTQSQIPPFRLVYFDPENETYQTLVSPSIPLTVLPSTLPPAIGDAAPPELPMPVEQMTDILSIATAGPRLLAPGSRVPSWLWQIVPALGAAALMIAIFRRHFAARFHRDPVELARRRDFRELERAGKDQVSFYRAAGHFVERWLGDSEEAAPRAVLERRDSTCFRKGAEAEPVPQGERQRILRELRRLALGLALLGFAALGEPLAAAEAGTEPADAATAYDEGRYAEAARLWLESGPYDQLSPDTLYNIGNAAYRLGSPGEAALFWRRALLRDETHPEARQNLRFFERKFGSIAVKRPDYQYVLARLPLSAWVGLMWGAAWLLALGLMVFPATPPGARLRIAAISALVSAPLLAAAGFCGWYYYPDDARFAAPAEQAITLGDRVTIRTDAARNAPSVIEAPAGSLCRILNESGDWAYVAFTNDTRGWVKRTDVARLVPNGKPEVPKPRETIDEEQSA